MADVLTIEANVVRASIERLRAVYPELDDDPELLSGMVDGSTNFDGVVNKLAMAFMEASALKAANAELQKSLRERGDRFDRKAEGYRAVMFDLMQTAGRQMMTLPAATVSIARGREVLVLDDDFNAQGYMRVKAEPMKADILAALKAGNQIPGARLEQTGEHLSIRTK